MRVDREAVLPRRGHWQRDVVAALPASRSSWRVVVLAALAYRICADGGRVRPLWHRGFRATAFAEGAHVERQAQVCRKRQHSAPTAPGASALCRLPLFGRVCLWDSFCPLGRAAGALAPRAVDGGATRRRFRRQRSKRGPPPACDATRCCIVAASGIIVLCCNEVARCWKRHSEEQVRGDAPPHMDLCTETNMSSRESWPSSGANALPMMSPSLEWGSRADLAELADVKQAEIARVRGPGLVERPAPAPSPLERSPEGMARAASDARLGRDSSGPTGGLPLSARAPSGSARGGGGGDPPPRSEGGAPARLGAGHALPAWPLLGLFLWRSESGRALL